MVKLIDFGLALKHALLQNAGSMQSGKTILSSSIAGTLDYAAPEQLGKLPGVRIGPPADIYGFAKTCCYALFETTEPTFQDYQRLPQWAELLGHCLNRNPDRRPASFAEVLERLGRLGQAQPAPKELTVSEPFLPDLRRDPALPVLPPLPPVAKVMPTPHDPEAETTARWQALKTQLQKQVRSSDWDGAGRRSMPCWPSNRMTATCWRRAITWKHGSMQRSHQCWTNQRPRRSRSSPVKWSTPSA